MVRDRIMELLAKEISRWRGSRHSIEGIPITIKHIDVIFREEDFEEFTVYDGGLSQRVPPSKRHWLNVRMLAGNERADGVAVITETRVPNMENGALSQSLELILQVAAKEAATNFLDRVIDYAKRRVPRSGLSREPCGVRHYGEIVNVPREQFSNLITLVKSLSAQIRCAQPYVFRSMGRGLLIRKISRIVNTEDNRVRSSNVIGNVWLEANLDKEDGSQIKVSSPPLYVGIDNLDGAEWAGLVLKKMEHELPHFRNSRFVESDNYPVLGDSGFASVFAHEVLGGHMTSGLYYAFNLTEPIRNRVGLPVISSNITLVDDPSFPEYGYMDYDDEGVRAREVVLVKDGRLVGFLTDRYSAFLLSQVLGRELLSNGHARMGDLSDLREIELEGDDERSIKMLVSLDSEPRQSNLIVKARNRVPRKELERLVIERARADHKQYALIAEGYREGGVWTGTGAVRLYPYKVTAVNVETGERFLAEQPLLQCSVQDAFTDAFIMGVGYGDRWHRGMCGAGSGYVPVATRAPSMALKNLTLTCESGEQLTQRWEPNTA